MLSPQTAFTLSLDLSMLGVLALTERGTSCGLLGPGGVARLGRKGAQASLSLPTDEVTMKEMGRNQQLRTGEVLIIVVVLFMWAGESGL